MLVVRGWRTFLLSVALAGAGLASAGCTDRACLQWSDADGPCPTADQALEFITGNGLACSEPLVISVDSEGEFDGQACCYDVTERDDDRRFGDEDIACEQFGPTPGEPPSQSDVGTGPAQPFCGDGICDPDFEETCEVCPEDCGTCICGDSTCDTAETCATCVSDCGTCNGCFIGQDGCIGCSELLALPECEGESLCSRSNAIFLGLFDCACASCPMHCPTACAGELPPTSECGECLSTACGMELNACLNDVSR